MRIATTLHRPNWDEPREVTGRVEASGEVVVETVDGWRVGEWWPDGLTQSLAVDELWAEYVRQQAQGEAR